MLQVSSATYELVRNVDRYTFERRLDSPNQAGAGASYTPPRMPHLSRCARAAARVAPSRSLRSDLLLLLLPPQAPLHQHTLLRACPRSAVAIARRRDARVGAHEAAAPAARRIRKTSNRERARESALLLVARHSIFSVHLTFNSQRRRSGALETRICSVTQARALSLPCL